ncbi:fatty acyl-CoA reductase 1-like [Hordeum vulgare]|nr:fatty acyl-CoA reductase 1-like [Hordeum vulgare]
MIGEMDVDKIVGYFRGRSILVTGSTGFLGKVLVEKILRVQPDVKKVYLLIRASDMESAKFRIQTEVIAREVFQVLREMHGVGFDNFIEEKICPLAGDIMYVNFGLGFAKVRELFKDIDIIVNGAATTNFFERYDVAFNANVLGVKHVCAFANKCTKLKMLLRVSTAYVAGEQEGLISEKPFLMGESLRVGTNTDIESELNFIQQIMGELKANSSTVMDERKTMKELGLMRARQFGWPNTYVFTKAMGEMMLGHMRGDFPLVIIRPSIITSTLKDPFPGYMEGIRTIDSVIVGYAKQTLSFFLADLNCIMDVVDSRRHGGERYDGFHGSTLRGSASAYHLPCKIIIAQPRTLRYPCRFRPSLLLRQSAMHGENGEFVRLKKMRFFRTLRGLRLYMAINYKLPLEMLHLANIVLCGIFSCRYNELSRKYKFAMHLIELYAPYSFFKGCFDDINLEKLRIAMKKGENNNGSNCFNFDPISIDWDDYFYSVHIPGVLKYTSV